MARKKEKISNPLLGYLDLSIKKQKGGGVKVTKAKVMIFPNDFREQQLKQIKIFKRECKKIGFNFKVRRIRKHEKIHR